MSKPSIMFVAGDPSGDEHASHVVEQLNGLLPGVHCFGIGGPAMQSHGFDPLLPFEDFNRMGFAEVLLHLPFFLHARRRLLNAMDADRPKALVCVDYPGLNIPLMKEAHRRGIPVVWYIVPQVWAWKEKRAALLGKYASFIGVVFPFEIDYFKEFAAPVSFVGHPLVEALDSGNAFSGADGPTEGRMRQLRQGLRLALVPGSRKQEITRILPHMLRASELLREGHPGLAVTVSKSKNLPAEFLRKFCAGRDVEIFEGPLRQLLRRSDCACVTSGTATLETALAGVPLVIAYRTSYLTYILMKRMIRLPYIGLPNIVAGEKIIQECIQRDANGAMLARQIGKLIDSDACYKETVERLSRLKGILGSRKPSREVAAAIAAVIGKKG